MKIEIVPFVIRSRVLDFPQTQDNDNLKHTPNRVLEYRTAFTLQSGQISKDELLDWIQNSGLFTDQ
jgi:hypothetical protein